MKNKYSTDIANKIKEFLTEDDWHYSFNEDNGLFRFGLSLRGKIKKVNYVVKVKEDSYIVYAISPVGADEEDAKMMSAMTEFLCRANYGLRNGNFEMDMADGEIRFKSFVDCEGIIPSRDMVENSIYCPASMFDRYGNGIVDVIFGGVSAKDAINKCEESTDKGLHSLISEMMAEGVDVEAMLERLAERVGGADESETAEETEKADAPKDVKMNLFNDEGGNE